MKRATITLIMMLTSLLACAGCLPGKMIRWSPDGQIGMLIGGTKVRFCDRDGKLMAPAIDRSATAVWAGDPKTIYAEVSEEMSTWKQAAEHLDADQQARVVAAAKDVLKQVLAFKGDPEKLDVDADLKSPQLELVMLYLKDNHAGQLKPRVPPKQWSELAKITIDYCRVKVYTLANGRLAEGKTLLEGFSRARALRVQPKGKALAVALADGKLLVVAPDGSAVPICDRAAAWPDWTPDGRSLAYIAPLDADADEDKARLGALRQRDVFMADGSLVKLTNAADKELAGVLFHPTARIRCLRDGRVLFTSPAAELPGRPVNPTKDVGLFILDESEDSGPQPIPIKTKEDGAQYFVDLFELSPDETRAAMVNPRGHVAILVLATGKVRLVQPEGVKPSNTRPTWRSKDELTYMAPKDKRQHKIVLHDLAADKVVTLSETWPAELVDEWLATKAERAKSE